MLCKSTFSEHFFKSSIKLLTSPFLIMLQTFFALSTQRVLVHLKGTPRALEGYLDTRRALGISVTQDNLALETLEDYLKYTRRALRYSRQLGIWVLEGHFGTQALKHLTTRDTQGILYSRLHLEQLLYRYQIELEISTKDSDFIFK